MFTIVENRMESRMDETDLEDAPLDEKALLPTSILKNKPPKGFRVGRSFALCRPRGFIPLYLSHAFAFVNRSYQLITYYLLHHKMFATMVLSCTALNLFCQCVIWVNYGGGSPVSELRRCCRRGAATNPVDKILIVERMGGSPLTGYVTIYAFLFIGNMTYLSVASALYGLAMFTMLSTQYVRISNHNCEKGEVAIHRAEIRCMFTLYTCFLALLTTTELVLACCLGLVLHPVAVFCWLATQSIARWLETRDLLQGAECLIMPVSYFAFSAPFGKNETCIGLSMLVESLRLMFGFMLFWYTDLPHGYADYLPSIVLSAIPELGRPMGHLVAKSKFLVPMMEYLNVSWACVASGFTSCGNATQVVVSVTTGNSTLISHGYTAVLQHGTPLFRAVLIGIIFVGVPISIIALMGILLFNSKLRSGYYTADDELEFNRILEKEDEIERWCERREKQLAGKSIMEMISRDLWICEDLDVDEGFDDIINTNVDIDDEHNVPKCQTCNGQGRYGCLYQECNECDGKGLQGHKRCKIEDTNVAQGRVPCPDSEYATCEYCSREFCTYHFFVNNSDAMGSFGGHVCPEAPDGVSRQKNAARAMGAMAGHFCGCW